jgi:hypothetical protein
MTYEVLASNRPTSHQSLSGLPSLRTYPSSKAPASPRHLTWPHHHRRTTMTPPVPVCSSCTQPIVLINIAQRCTNPSCGMVVCFMCAAKRPGFCWRCSNPLAPLLPPNASPTPQPNPSGYTHSGVPCPHCGGSMPGRYNVCIHCKRDVFWGSPQNPRPFASQHAASEDALRARQIAAAAADKQFQIEQQRRLKEDERAYHFAFSSTAVMCIGGLLGAITFLVYSTSPQADTSTPWFVQYCFHCAVGLVFLGTTIQDARYALRNLSGLFLLFVILGFFVFSALGSAAFAGWLSSFFLVFASFCIECAIRQGNSK